MKKKYFLIVIVILVLIAIFIALIPPVRDRVSFHAEKLWIRVYYLLNPPEKAVFVPDTPQPDEKITLQPTCTKMPTSTATLTPEVIEDTPTPLPTATPLPEAYKIEGVPYIDQHSANNYCAPANLAMALGYWDWEVDRSEIGTSLKPYPEDFNVMPYELDDYVKNKTELLSILRSGGTPELLKKLVSAQYPVLIETGRYMVDLSGKLSWMGHYTVVIGYDDAADIFIAHDSYYTADYELTYEELMEQWRSFNFTFLVVYPQEEQASLFEVLGDYVDENSANRIAYEIATDEVWSQEGVNQYFAWFNRGSSMVALLDYSGAAESYDKSFEVYDALPEGERPYRMLWYQTGPYFAYFNTGRYQTVVELATFTLDNARLKILEESYVWRARAEAALGDYEAAQEDLCKALEYHAGFDAAEQAIVTLGLSECP
jgi:hypothetical protein